MSNISTRFSAVALLRAAYILGLGSPLAYTPGNAWFAGEPNTPSTLALIGTGLVGLTAARRGNAVKTKKFISTLVFLAFGVTQASAGTISYNISLGSDLRAYSGAVVGNTLYGGVRDDTTGQGYLLTADLFSIWSGAAGVHHTLTPLSGVGGLDFFPGGFSANGQYLVGASYNFAIQDPVGGQGTMFLMSDLMNPIALGYLSAAAQESLANGVATDGTAVFDAGSRAAIRALGGVIEALPMPSVGAGLSSAEYISADGTVVAGAATNGITSAPYYWRRAGGTVIAHGELPCGVGGLVIGGSPNGNTLAGSCGGSPAIWTRTATGWSLSILSVSGVPSCFGRAASATNKGAVTGYCAGGGAFRYQVGDASATLTQTLLGLPTPLNTSWFIGDWIDPSGVLQNIALDNGSIYLNISQSTATPLQGGEVPEPGTMLLLGGGLAALAAARKRREV